MARYKVNTKSVRKPWVNLKPRFDGLQAQQAMALLGDDPRNVENWLSSLERRAEITRCWLTRFATH